MNKTEIAETLRLEVGHLEISIKKLQDRCDKLKRFVLDLEEEIASPAVQNQRPAENSKFRKVVDQIFGEKAKRAKR